MTTAGSVPEGQCEPEGALLLGAESQVGGAEDEHEPESGQLSAQAVTQARPCRWLAGLAALLPLALLALLGLLSWRYLADADLPPPFELTAAWLVDGAAAEEASRRLRLLSAHWTDVNGDLCPDLLTVYQREAAPGQRPAEQQPSLRYGLLLHSCSGSVRARQPFRLLSGPEVGLSLRHAGGAAGVSTLLLDVNSDYYEDVCHYACSQSAPACRCQLTCALNSFDFNASSRIDTAFSWLTPWAEDGGRDDSPTAVTVLTGWDWDGDGLVNLLRPSSCSSEPALRSLSLQPAFAPSFTASPASCLQRAVQSGSGVSDECVLRSRAESGLVNASSLSAAWSSADCSIAMLLANFPARWPGAALVCIGPHFPSQLRVFSRPAQGSRSLQDATQRFRPRLPRGETLSVLHACMGDYNGDLVPDYVLATEEQGGLVVALSGPAGRRLRYELSAAGLPSDADVETQAAAAGAVLAVGCLDADNDGDMDVLALRGDASGGGRPLALLLYYNANGTGRFHAVRRLSPSYGELTQTAAAALHSASTPPATAALAVADYDSDGWLDVAVARSEGTLTLYRNTQRHLAEAASAGHWLEVSVYAAASKRFPALASGLIVELRLDSGRLQLSRVVQDSGMGSAGVQGQHHIRLHFGLGQHRVVQQLLVHKPGTSPRLYTEVAADQHLRILLPSMLRPPTRALAESLRGYHFLEGNCSLDGQRRLEPAFFIIGVNKCGTTSLYHTLSQHPLILPPATTKELQYFPWLHETMGLRWYAAHFHCGDPGQLTFDASPNYLYAPDTAAGLLTAFPRAKLILLLRDPVWRAHSHYRHIQRVRRLRWAGSAAAAATDGPEEFHLAVLEQLADFTRCLAEEQRGLPAAERGEQRLQDAVNDTCAARQAQVNNWLTTSLYSVFLMRWLPLLPEPASSLLVIATEQLEGEPAAVLSGLLAFLGLPDHPLQLERSNVAPEGGRMLPQTERLLRELYAPFNRRLLQLITMHARYRPPWIQSDALSSEQP